MFENRTFLIALASDKTISKEEYRILLYILGKCNSDYSLKSTMQEIVDGTGIKKPNVSRSLTSICARGILERKDETTAGNKPIAMTLSISKKLVKRYYSLEEALFDEGYCLD